MPVNLLSPLNLPPPPPPLSLNTKRRPARFFGLVALFGLLITFGLTLFGVGSLVSGAVTLKSAVPRGELALQAADFRAAEAALSEASRGLASLERGFRFVSYAKILPWLGDNLKEAHLATSAAQNTVSVLESGVAIGQDIFSLVDVEPYGNLTTDQKRNLLTSLTGSLPELRDMQVRLRLAQDDLNRLAEDELSAFVSGAVDPLKELVPELRANLDFLVPLAAIAPEFAGLSEAKQFLILFLNNSELRPGGGVIDIYGLLLMEDGQITSLATSDSSALDQLVAGSDYSVVPPGPLANHLHLSKWYFRDSAWSPDFAQTALDATQLFRQESAFARQPIPEIDGVIGLTPTFIAELLSITGPITVEGQTFKSDNVRDALEYEVQVADAQNGIPEAQRKEIVSLLVNELLDRLFSLSPSSWPEIFKALNIGFAQKNLALQSFSPKTQAALEDYDWAGRIVANQTDDVLMLVDANLGALKTDRVIARQVSYKIAPQGETYRATATVSYEHNGSFDWQTTRYKTYARLFVPVGSKFVSSSLPSVVTENVLGLTTFGAHVVVEPGQTSIVTFTYDLPTTIADAVERGTYRLMAIKQLGGGDNLLTLDLDFGTTVASAVPAEAANEFHDHNYRLTTPLTTDSLFLVRFR